MRYIYLFLLANIFNSSLTFITIKSAFTSFEGNENSSPFYANGRSLNDFERIELLKVLPPREEKNETFPTLFKSHIKKKFHLKLQQINNLQINVARAYEKANSPLLFKIYNEFKNLEYTEDDWEILSKEFNARKWPLQQTWKQALGGHLFFPRDQIYKYSESTYTEHMTARRDIINGSLIAGCFYHPLAFLHLATTLIKVSSRGDENFNHQTHKSSFFNQLFEKSLPDLKLFINEPDIFYSVWHSYYTCPMELAPYINLQSDFVPLEFKDLRSQFITLEIKRKYPKLFDRIYPENYLELAQNGFHPAYYKAAQLAKLYNDEEKEKRILREAAEAHYPVAYLRLAEKTVDNDVNEAQTWIQKGMNDLLPQAFISKGFVLLGDIKWRKINKKLSSVSFEIKNEALNSFRQAGELGDPQGFEYLGQLKYKLFKQESSLQEKKKLKEEAQDAFIKGCILGSGECYQYLSSLSSELYKRVCASIGADPRINLWLFCKIFLNKEAGFSF